MEPEAQLIAAQAAEELARQQATGTVDELQRGRMAQQILGGAAQQAQAREAQQRQAEFARRKRLGDVVAAGEAEKRLREYRKKTQDIGGMLQAGLVEIVEPVPVVPSLSGSEQADDFVEEFREEPAVKRSIITRLINRVRGL